MCKPSTPYLVWCIDAYPSYLCVPYVWQSAVLQQRVAAAVGLASKRGSSVLLLSGGVPPGAPEASEAAAMHAYAQRCHLGTRRRVLLEQLSHTTRQNAVLTFALLRAEEPRISSLTVVTSRFHARRACAVFRRLSPAHLRVHCACIPATSDAGNTACPHGESKKGWLPGGGGSMGGSPRPSSLRLEVGYLLLREFAALVVYWAHGWL